MANREEQLKQITEKLEKGVAEIFTSEKYAEYLNTMAKFHNYSFNNTLLIAMQKPEATLVAGYQAWQKKFNRQVKRGEKGIQIIAPMPVREKHEIEKVDPETGEIILGEDGQPETEVVEHVVPRFHVTTVFDVSQTMGEPIPEFEISELDGNVFVYDSFMEALKSVAPVPIQFMEIEGEAKGYYHLTDKYIAIQDGMSEAQTMKTAVHETAHATLHDRDQMKDERIAKDKLTREVEAESVAYVVCDHFGLDTSEYSFSYIASWSSDKTMKELRDSMDSIRKTSADMIEQLESKLRELERNLLIHREFVRNDPVLKISGSMGSEYEYNLIEGITIEELRMMVKEYRSLVEKNEIIENEQPLVHYLEDHGAVVKVLYSSDRTEIDRPIEFFDVEYDVDAGVTLLEELSAEKKAEMLIEKAEFPDFLFNDDDKAFIKEFSTYTNDLELLTDLVWGMKDAMENPDIRKISEIKKTIRERYMTKENMLIGGKGNHYGIYQLQYTEQRNYQFMGVNEAVRFGFEIHGKDYELIYSDQLAPEDTLDSLFEKFNINHPRDFTGHSLSVSDVIVVNKDGTLKAYYVDSFGFEELPDFIVQRMALINETPVRSNSDVYLGTLEQAMEEKNVDAYLDSRKLNIDCKNAIEQAIKENYDGMYLNHDVALSVIDEYGAERVAFVLANTLKYLSYDGRLSNANKHWAEGINVPENISRGMDLNRDYIVSSHPAVLDGFINLARNEIRTRKLEQIVGIRNVHITKDTRGYEADGHMGTWYAIDVKEYHGESFFQMRSEQYEKEVADIIVSENGTLVAEDVWHGFDEGATEAISEYLEGNGATVYDLSEFPPNTIVTLQSGERLTTEELQPVENDTWAEAMVGKSKSGNEIWFNFYAVSMVELPNGIKLKVPESHYIDQYYVIEDLQVKGSLQIERYESLEEALEAYYSLPNHRMKALGIENTAPLKGSLDFIQCQNGIDTLIRDCQKSEGWLNPQIYQTFMAIQNSLDMHDTEIAYRIGEEYFSIQTVSDGYDYTFYDGDYLEKDGGIYDDPETSISEAIEFILEEEGFSKRDTVVMDYEELGLKTEHAEKEHIIRKQLEMFCPPSIFDGFDRNIALKTFEGITVQFIEGKTYLTVQPTEEGYSYIFYDEKLHEISGGIYDYIDDSIQEATYEILKKEGMYNEKCVKLDDKKFRESVIQHSLDLLQKGDVRYTSELGRCEVSLNGMSRAEIEYDVLSHARAVLEEMGLENEVTLIGARVYGSRSRDGMYNKDSDVDVALSYRGSIREDTLFNAVNEAGLQIAGISVDINPISEEETGTLTEYMKAAEKYLDDKEVEKLAIDLDQFAHDYDHYNYDDVVQDREENVKKIHTCIVTGKVDSIMEWIAEIAVDENDDLPEDVEEAKKLMDRIKKVQEKVGKEKHTEPERTDATISFYTAECMEFPVLGEYHDNLSLEEALALYEKIPAGRMNGIKGIGFILEDGSDYDGPYDLMRMGKVDREGIEIVQHYKESPLVQKAMQDVETYFANKRDIAKKTEQIIEEKQIPTKSETQPKSKKESVLQALRERQARKNEQEQNETKVKSKTHKRGDVTL